MSCRTDKAAFLSLTPQLETSHGSDLAGKSPSQYLSTYRTKTLHSQSSLDKNHTCRRSKLQTGYMLYKDIGRILNDAFFTEWHTFFKLLGSEWFLNSLHWPEGSQTPTHSKRMELVDAEWNSSPASLTFHARSKAHAASSSKKGLNKSGAAFMPYSGPLWAGFPPTEEK